MSKIAIVGFGCAGYNAMRAIRKIDKDCEIDVYERTAKPPFNPMLSTYFASEKLQGTQVFPFGDIADIKGEYEFNLINNCVAEHVDVENKTVITSDGTSKSYDKILIATGASAVIPGFLKVETDKVFLMRTLEDAEKLKNYLDTHEIKHASVVGGSMVGIKVAELLFRRGIKTDIVDAAGYLFPLAAHENIAHKIENKLKDMGVDILMDKKVSKITDDGVVFADGELLEADMVCLCVGTRTNLQLVANTEVVKNEKLNINRGIVIDSHSRTSVDGIYAAGDCCEGVNLQTGEPAIIGLWANAAAQGTCAGRNMAGVNDEYYGNILHNTTHFFDMDFVGLGNPMMDGDYYEFNFDDFDVTLKKKDGKLQSLNIFGNYRISGVLKSFLIKQLLGEDAHLTKAQKGILEKSGFSKELIEAIGE